MTKVALFLDFDGVICDSVDECFLSSWIAYYQFYLEDSPQAVSLEEKRRFRSLRPFIRSGEDYVLIQDLIAGDHQIKNQAEFDLMVREKGAELMDHFKELFYRAREEQIKRDRKAWLRLSKPYPGFTKRLKNIVGLSSCFILSSKRPEFIREILLSWDINWPLGRILYPDKREKRELIMEHLVDLKHTVGIEEAIFVEDQIDHLAKVPDREVRCILAAWGYVVADWLDQDKYEVMSLSDFLQLIDSIS